MSADVVNLRRARKAKVRADKDKVASENRVSFGRTKAERLRTAAEQTLRIRAIEGQRLDKE